MNQLLTTYIVFLYFITKETPCVRPTSRDSAMKRPGLKLVSFFVILLLDYGSLQKCLKQFLRTDYHFYQISTSKEVRNCIAGGSHNQQEFQHQCPNSTAMLSESLELYRENPKVLYENILTKHTYKYEEDLIYIEERHSGHINIAEQLELYFNNCSIVIQPWDRLILQVFHRGTNGAEYAYIFLVPKDFALNPISSFAGYIMVPYKALGRSLILTKDRLKVLNRSFITMNQIKELMICDMTSLWKGTCQKNGSNQNWLNINWVWRISIVLFVALEH